MKIELRVLRNHDRTKTIKISLFHKTFSSKYFLRGYFSKNIIGEVELVSTSFKEVINQIKNSSILDDFTIKILEKVR